jgi:hypothetical protein
MKHRLLEKLSVPELVKKFSFYGTYSFITVFTRTSHLFLFGTR